MKSSEHQSIHINYFGLIMQTRSGLVLKPAPPKQPQTTPQVPAFGSGINNTLNSNPFGNSFGANNFPSFQNNAQGSVVLLRENDKVEMAKKTAAIIVTISHGGSSDPHFTNNPQKS